MALILLVDDDPDQLEIRRLLLETGGFEVRTASTTGEAERLFGECPPALVVTDLDRAWANVYVEEPNVPKIKLGDAAEVITDAGQRVAGKVSFISPRAEFTPRNVQTANDRAKLVYRMKISVDNRGGVLKPGMPCGSTGPPEAGTFCAVATLATYWGHKRYREQNHSPAATKMQLADHERLHCGTSVTAYGSSSVSQ